MNEFKHLTATAVKAIHEVVLGKHGGSPGIRDEGLLESALAAPQATFGGEPIMKDKVEVAAAYLFYLCNNHPFIDGNNRTALASCLVFLRENGLFDDPLLPSRNTDDWESLVLDVAASRLDRAATTQRLSELLLSP